MNEKPKTSTCFILSISAPVSFLIGLVIGLVVLGWWLWPVDWVDGDPTMLASGYQQDYLSAAVDSYVYNNDELLAQTRYNSLGKYKDNTLAQLYASSPDRAADIERYAAAVGATDALTAPIPSAEGTTQPASGPVPLTQRILKTPVLLGTGALCIGFLIIAIALIVIVSINKQKDNPPEAVEAVSPIPPGSEWSEAQYVEEVPGTVESAADDQAVPDWLNETTPDSYETDGSYESVPAESAVENETAGEAETYPFTEELPLNTDDELSDEDIAAITSQDFTPAGAGLAGAAILGSLAADGEEIHFPGTPAAGDIAGAALVTDGLAADELWPEEPGDEIGAAGEPDAETAELAVEEMIPPAEFTADETTEMTQSKFSRDISSLEGIQPDEAELLHGAGVSVPLLLLRRGATAEGRQEISQQTGISDDRLLEWVNTVDLFRVKGVDQETANLLEAAGVDSVTTLANSDPSDLHSRVLNALNEMKAGNRTASIETVEAWIAQAKKLPKTVL